MATKGRSKTPDNNTLALFKAWLSGIEEMQGEDWTPNATQWKRIKDKLMLIEENAAPEPAPAPARHFMQAPQQFAPAPVQYMPAPSSFDGGVQPSQKTPDIDSSNGYQSALI